MKGGAAALPVHFLSHKCSLAIPSKWVTALPGPLNSEGNRSRAPASAHCANFGLRLASDTMMSFEMARLTAGK